MVFASHCVIVGYAIWGGAFSCILHVASIDLGWVSEACSTSSSRPLGPLS